MRILKIAALCLVMISCTEIITENHFTAPELNDITIETQENGLKLNYTLDVFDNYSARFVIYRGTSTRDLTVIGETTNQYFTDYFAESGKQYFYRIGCSLQENNGYSYFSTESETVTSPVCGTSYGKLPPVSNVSITTGGGEVRLDWDDMTIDYLSGFQVTYGISKSLSSHNYYSGHYSEYSTFLNSEYIDTAFDEQYTADMEYFYRINYYLFNSDKSIIYYGTPSSEISGIPNG